MNIWENPILSETVSWWRQGGPDPESRMWLSLENRILPQGRKGRKVWAPKCILLRCWEWGEGTPDTTELLNKLCDSSPTLGDLKKITPETVGWWQCGGRVDNVQKVAITFDSNSAAR